MSEHTIEVTVNGRTYRREVPARRTLVDFLRYDCGLTGTHVGCEHGVCGACTIVIDGAAVRSCLMLAVQADGLEVRTVEGVAASDGTLHPVQTALHEEHGLQCGFCTPGIVMTLYSLVEAETPPSEEKLRDAAAGHLCRCTGYQGILRAIRRLAADAGAATSTGDSAR